MKSTVELQVWLPWVTKIRFVIITFVFAIEFAIQQVVPDPSRPNAIKYLGVVIILWYTLGLFYLIYSEISRDFKQQAYLQILSDLAIVTAVVHVTGDLESNYLSLYPVAIILASVLLSRGKALVVAGASFVFMGALLELAYLPNLLPEIARRHRFLRILATSSEQSVDLGTLQVKIVASLFGFLAVAYLSSYLAESLRETRAELRDKRGEVASLQAINENIIRSMRDGLITADLEGRIQELNPAGAAILGRRLWDLKELSIEEVLPGGPRVGQIGQDDSTSHVRQEITYRHPRGEDRILGVAASPLILPEVGAVGYVFNIQDLTEQRRREAEYRAKDRMAALGHLSAGIAHEIRNPLASIAGSVKLLQRLAQLDEDQAKLIDIVSRESERLNKLVSDILIYSRDQRFEFREVDLANILEETLLLIEHHPLFGSGYRIERKLPRRSVSACADADKIRQVFWNICDNSLKAMPQGGTLTAEIEDKHPQNVRVVLSDTGIGFDQTQLEKLFEPFQAGFANGTGLGMAIVYQIVQGHSGSLRVDSAPGKGAKFLIDLPRNRPQSS
ncbi:MAG TPA: ATP-binding protein [Terriglobia bacterium]|nr:ATP-binding protein [Terriglobia bacterium]